MAEQAKRAPEKAPRMRLSQERRERFLEVLGETGNRRLAAEAIGVEPRLMDQRRRFDPLLDRQWREALGRAERRLAGAAGPLDTGREFNVIRKAPNGRTQIVTAGPKRWSQKVEARFLAALGMCGNVAAAARSVGFSEGAIWQRRRKFTAFAQAMEEVLEEAEIRIEFRLAAMGSDLAAAGLDSFAATEAAANRYGAENRDGAGSSDHPHPRPLPQAGGETPFDADMAFRFLKWREAKRQGRAPRQGHGAPKRMSFEDSIALLDKKLKAFGARHRREQLAQGWAEDEAGRMIPPGWVRSEPPGDA
ncbi:hypothetical protein [Sphingosinicella sp. YJ22]|uniref:hypothetical protein n=1 Tax=Sphingosinicella sp. YJ22 TaxID=1104780 RepID=UPI00140A0607|nr:hypothetical protein [Sphingosinicella sp. YJ22]